jgi:hypothetical protein
VSVEQDHLLRVMLLSEQRLFAEMVDLTLNHGVYVLRTAGMLVARRRSSPRGTRTSPSLTWRAPTSRSSDGSGAITRARARGFRCSP